MIQTVLQTCLPPTVGFHVLSRTGHTNLLDSFWLRLNNVLHASGHLKYQELYLFYGLFRSIMPQASFADLFTSKPGAMVARVPSFTAGLGSPYDARGHTYVHLDEALETLIIRHVKGLKNLMLPYLESCGAWLLLVCGARMLIRTVTAAPRAYRRFPNDDHGGTQGTASPGQGYDRNAVQSSKVRAIVELMRQNGFISLEHHQSEKLQNVFSATLEVLGNSDVQELILDLDNHGRISSELHASEMSPDVFGPISQQECDKYFKGKRLKGNGQGKDRSQLLELPLRRKGNLNCA